MPVILAFIFCIPSQTSNPGKTGSTKVYKNDPVQRLKIQVTKIITQNLHRPTERMSRCGHFLCISHKSNPWSRLKNNTNGKQTIVESIPSGVISR